MPSPTPPDLQIIPDVVRRPHSVRSVASNSSIASGTSLTRRPRIRARSRTVTGEPSPHLDGYPESPRSFLPYLDDNTLTAEPVEGILEVPSTSASHEPLTLPPSRPPRSPHRLEAEPFSSSHESNLSQESELITAADPTLVQSLPQQSVSSGVSKTKAARQMTSLPVIDTSYNPPPSAFSRDPAITPVINVRDSVSTQQSGTSSSIYPPSTSTASGPESPPSPRSIAEQLESVPPIVSLPNEQEEYDNDDVAYRLRLLVKNNYFLPPAHSKPSSSDFAASTNAQKKPPQKSSPTFLDLFRVGKSKSKPTTPTGNPPGFDPNAPMLRTTSESITTSFALRGGQPRPSPSSRISPHSPSVTPRGRVVVVREKMNNIAVAAKQSEQELKNRGVPVDQIPPKDNQEIFDNVIDPTDAVDLPPVSAAYPFAVQASALHGLGVQDSVGAAVLADRLPPPKSSSNSWDVEDDWRKALLHEAVHHSLDNTPDVSTFSQARENSTPRRTSGASTSLPLNSPSPSSGKVFLERKILDPPMLEVLNASPPIKKRRKSTQSQASASKVAGDNVLTISASSNNRESSRLSGIPIRVDTPTGPLTPLTPAPRRNFFNPLFSLSQTSLPSITSGDPPRSISRASGHTLRRAISTPMLSDAFDTASRHELTPPPVPMLSVYSQSSSHFGGSFVTSRQYSRHGSTAASESQSHYTDDEYASGRGSLALSAVGRPSLSEYSQSSQSPTTSAFQDALNHGGYQSASSSIHNPSQLNADSRPVTRDSSTMRYSAMSPPPRVSSSLAHVSLQPPPRASSMRYQVEASSSPQSLPSVPVQVNSSASGAHEEDTVQFVAPEPTTPPLPISSRRGNSIHTPLSLDIPSSGIPVTIHSAPGPSAPTSFFDDIQTHPNAMDDLDSSSDESDDEPLAIEPPYPPPLYMDPRTRVVSNISNIPSTSARPPIMRFGNHSTPYVSTTSSSSYKSISNDSAKKPVGNIAARAPFFSERKSDQGHGIPSSPMDFYKYAQEHPPPTAKVDETRQATTSTNVTQWQTNQRAQDSLRKLDGMLIQHMESEKDTIKRIATTVNPPKSNPWNK